jgi:hypothetical protein
MDALVERVVCDVGGVIDSSRDCCIAVVKHKSMACLKEFLKHF